MASTLTRGFYSTSNIAAQDLIRIQSTVVKIGMLRLKCRILKINKWPYKFVVLTHDSIIVYENESSKKPKLQFSLLGYNRVSRCDVKGLDWCFSILPASNIDSVKVKMFSCISNAERKSWMLAIKTQIYAANNVERPAMTILDQIKSMTIGYSEEDDYKDIEHKVFETADAADTKKDSKESDDDSDTDSHSEENSPVIKKTTRSLSLPQNSVHMYTKSRKFSEVTDDYISLDYEPFDNLILSTSSSQKSKRRLPSDPQPRIPGDVGKISRPYSDFPQIPPPRYSQVCIKEEQQEEPQEHHYVNIRRARDSDYYEICEHTFQPSLESLSTVVDMDLNRDQLIQLLQTKMSGTYLIRRSRTVNQKVLAFLAQDKQVKEYKIQGTPDDCTIDLTTYFTNIEELLQHYTSVEKLPTVNGFLKRGIYHVDAENET